MMKTSCLLYICVKLRFFSYIQVKINPIVNYEWELRYHTGNIVAVHRDALYIAYVLRGESSLLYIGIMGQWVTATVFNI